MAKAQKELAFLRELYLEEQWTKRFTDLVDKHIKFSDDENFLYMNAGTGGHVFELREKIGKDTVMFATCENAEVLAIARDKAAAVKVDVDFASIRFEDDAFDSVVADGSLVRPEALKEFVENITRVARPGGKIYSFLVTAGSFGEIFSLLWEVLFSEELGENGAEVERLIATLPTVSRVEAMAEEAGLRRIETHTANEVFEHNNGAEFVNSSLVGDFLLPEWLKNLTEKEKEQVTNKLAQLVDAEGRGLTFRFSVKATLLIAEKA